MPPRSPPSKRPRKRRHTTSPAKLLVKPRKVLTMPQHVINVGRYIYTRPDLFDNPVAWYVDKNVGDVEYQERYVELSSSGDIEVLGKAIDLSVSNVAFVNEGK